MRNLAIIILCGTLEANGAVARPGEHFRAAHPPISVGACRPAFGLPWLRPEPVLRPERPWWMPRPAVRPLLAGEPRERSFWRWR